MWLPLTNHLPGSAVEQLSSTLNTKDVGTCCLPVPLGSKLCGKEMELKCSSMVDCLSAVNGLWAYFLAQSRRKRAGEED